MKRGKILIVANSSGFILNFELALIRALQSTLEVVAVTPHDDRSSRFASLGVRFVALPMSRRGLNPFGDISMALGLYRIYKREVPEVLLHNTIKPVIYGSIAARAAGIKAILNMIPGLGYVFTGQTLRHRSLRHLVKFMYRCALDGSHRVFFQNPDDRRYFVENALVKADKAELTYGLGVDLERFQYVEPTATSQGCTFILVSRMLWDKGVGEYVAAAADLKRTFVEARFQLLGPLDPDNPSHIKRETIDEWHRSGVVEYLGEVSDVRPILEKADVVVLPSYYREGVPNALLEGLALGRPVITTDAPGCRETVVDTVNGLLIPPRDVAALSAAMRYLITHRERRLEMGWEGRKLAVERFDVNLVNAIILRAINAS
jgi:glycosyltransferase involved in cell wall biosynthesis